MLDEPPPKSSQTRKTHLLPSPPHNNANILLPVPRGCLARNVQNLFLSLGLTCMRSMRSSTKVTRKSPKRPNSHGNTGVSFLQTREWEGITGLVCAPYNGHYDGTVPRMPATHQNARRQLSPYTSCLLPNVLRDTNTTGGDR